MRRLVGLQQFVLKGYESWTGCRKPTGTECCAVADSNQSVHGAMEVTAIPVGSTSEPGCHAKATVAAVQSGWPTAFSLQGAVLWRRMERKRTTP